MEVKRDAETGVFSLAGTPEEFEPILEILEDAWGVEDDFVAELESAINDALETDGSTASIDVPGDTIYDLGDVLSGCGDESLEALGENIHDQVAAASGGEG